MLLAEEESDELDPFGLPEGMELLVAEVGDEGDAGLLDDVIASALEGRDEDDLGLSRQDELCVEIALHAYLDDASVFHARPHVLVEEVLRARDAANHIERI